MEDGGMRGAGLGFPKQRKYLDSRKETSAQQRNLIRNKKKYLRCFCSFVPRNVKFSTVAGKP